MANLKKKARWDFIQLRIKQGWNYSRIEQELNLSRGSLKVWISRNRSKYETLEPEEQEQELFEWEPRYLDYFIENLDPKIRRKYPTNPLFFPIRDLVLYYCKYLNYDIIFSEKKRRS